MIRKRLSLGGGCLLIIVALTGIAMTQEDAPFRNLNRGPVPEPAEQHLLTPKNPGGGTVFDSAGSGPVGTPGYYVPNDNSQPEVYRFRTVPVTVYQQTREPFPPEELRQLQLFQKAKLSLKQARDEKGRKSATDIIQKHLVKQFEQDLAQREKELAAVEERVKTLRQQLDKRKLAKDDIITLRLKTIVNNAEGLGFPGEDDPQEGTNFGPTYSPGAYGMPPSSNSAPSFNPSSSVTPSPFPRSSVPTPVDDDRFPSPDQPEGEGPKPQLPVRKD